MDRIYKDDQDLRQELKAAEGKYGRKSDEMNAHWKKMLRTIRLTSLKFRRFLVKEESTNARSLALLEDRVDLRKGEKQIYGSQIGRNQETGNHYVLPLKDPDIVDARREAVGLGTLQSYISHWDITWDVEKYKKPLPEIKNTLKKE